MSRRVVDRSALDGAFLIVVQKDGSKGLKALAWRGILAGRRPCPTAIGRSYERAGTIEIKSQAFPENGQSVDVKARVYQVAGPDVGTIRYLLSVEIGELVGGGVEVIAGTEHIDGIDLSGGKSERGDNSGRAVDAIVARHLVFSRAGSDKQSKNEAGEKTGGSTHGDPFGL